MGIEERSEMDGVGWTCCCRGEPDGDPDDSEPLSDPDEERISLSCAILAYAAFRSHWGRHTSSSVKRLNGQKASSSSSSKPLAACSTRK